MRIKLPKLLFGYILASVSLIDAAHRRRSKATMTVSPQLCSDLFAKMLLDFDRLMEADAISMLQSPLPQTPSSTPVPDDEQGSLDYDDDNNHGHANNNANDVDDEERIKFGFNKNEWKAFLRRLGLDHLGEKDSQS